MYLFIRRARLRAGGINESMAWATGITERAHQVTGLRISLFTGVFGPGVGTVAWSALVPDLETLETANDKLNADPGYLEEASRGQQFAPEGADDRLRQYVHPQLTMAEMAGAPTPMYITVVSSVCVAGGFARGMELGVQLAQRAEEITGVPTSFLVDSTGMFGGVSWSSGYPDIRSLQAAEGALATDTEWLAMIDREAKGVYSDDPSLTTQLIWRRII